MWDYLSVGTDVVAVVHAGEEEVVASEEHAKFCTVVVGPCAIAAPDSFPRNHHIRRTVFEPEDTHSRRMCGHEGAEGSYPEHVHHEEDSYEVEALRSHRLEEVHRDCSANSSVVEHRTLAVGDDIPWKPMDQGDDSGAPEVRWGCGRLACAL